MGNSILTVLTKIASGYWHINDPQNGYTAISRATLENLDLDKIYTNYGYCNDLLVRLNVFGYVVRDVKIPARYGNEKSKINYSNYIVRVSSLLLRDFFWRLKTKYISKGLHPIAIFYLLGILLTFSGLGLGLYSIFYRLVFGQSFFIRNVISFMIFIVGLLFLLFAIIFDIQMNAYEQVKPD